MSEGSSMTRPKYQFMVYWAYMSLAWVCPLNVISIGSAVFADPMHHVPNAYTDTDHATCDKCSNRCHLCIACRRWGL